MQEVCQGEEDRTLSCIFATARQSFPCTSVSSLAFVWHLVPWLSSLVGVRTWIRDVKYVGRAGGHRRAGSENLRRGGRLCAVCSRQRQHWRRQWWTMLRWPKTVVRGPLSGPPVSARSIQNDATTTCRSSQRWESTLLPQQGDCWLGLTWHRSP